MDAPHHEHPYLVYSRGLRPEDLQLGSLCLDPTNPVDDPRKIHQCLIKNADLLPWISSPSEETTCALNLEVSREWLAGANGLDSITEEANENCDIAIRVEGEKGRRVQIERPETFLEQVVLPSADIKQWLATQLTVSRTMHYLSRAIFETARQPRIWLVTGLQYITSARIEAGWSHSPHASMGIPGPILDPTMAALTGLSDVGNNMKNPQRCTETGGSADDATGTTSIWAAQFMELKLGFRPHKMNDTKLPEEIQLHKFGQLGGMGQKDHEPVPSQEIARVEGLAAESAGGVRDRQEQMPPVKVVTFLGMECEDRILYEELLDQVESRMGRR
ncbi:uncharacterized protein BO97DRAFT_443094 [Aspergillus homomorphus CBS 101889]|uniref:Uncharacterized protein n=1 Tax=Aspergillus homomorphus (strain CBS 101889) TaxID=1450537 RepID=A0A395HX38_ASPHC|nr:hypothetical protein BO97DRAFT_443094 [Aspergillus homomorphus CBS 101889]RAL12482.1 hypothetical protein BO97DRAFT_443094 [Aspergillus homomorphus CBS 101889]